MNFQDIKLSTLSPGTYTIKAIFDGDDTYEAAETEFTLIIDANNEAHVVIPDSGSAEQGAKRHPSLAFTEATQTKTEVSSHKYQLQMPANPNMLDLVWSCNNSSVSIDATGKTITIPNAPATCTITASFSGNSLYYAASASYTLTIEEANSGSSTPTPTPTPSEEEEDDPRYYNIYFEEQMVAQQVNQSMVYTLQAPKTQETTSGTLPSNIRDCCYFTLDDSPTHIPISSQIAISQEGMHILTLHFTGTSDYDPYNIAYTLTVGDIQNTIEKKSLNLRFSAASYSYDGTGEARYTFSYDTQYPISQSKFSINLTDLTNSSTNPRTSSYSYTEKYVVLDTTTLVEGHEYQISIKYDGDANYKVGTATTRVLYQQQEQPQPQSEYANKYFTIESLEDNNDIQFYRDSVDGVDYTVEYSTNGTIWNSFIIGTSSNRNITIASLNRGGKIYIRGNHYAYNGYRLTSTKQYKVYGNIMSLIYSDNFVGQTSFAANSTHNFYNLFASSNIVDATNLVLPVTTLTSNCYRGMFSYCRSLVNPPSLPATTLAERCYQEMFLNCHSLIIAPSLPATTLADRCYLSMFQYCNSLTTTPSLPATTLTRECYSYMFKYCSSLTNVTSISATTLAYRCCFGMFIGCTSLNTPPALPATTLAENCYESMFAGCNSLNAMPALPATTLANYCYDEMFESCTSLNTISTLPATTLANGCYLSMFWNCTSLNIVPSNLLPATTLAEECYMYMFRDCTSLNTPPTLPATTLTKDCYVSMFSGCTSLKTAPELPATTLAYRCYEHMFYNCISLINAPSILPATTLAQYCYSYMFEDCTSLISAPALPATTLISGCYGGMFHGCTSLNYIKALFTTNISSNYNFTLEWLQNVASSGTFIKNTSATWNRTDESGIPSGWTVQYASS